MKRSKRIWNYFLLLVLLIVVTLAIIFYFVPIDKNVKAPGKVIPEDRAEVKTRVRGIIQEIYICEGDIVEPGDKLALINDDELKEIEYSLNRQKDEFSGQLKRMKEKLELMNTRIHPLEMSQLQGSIEQAKLERRRTETRYNRVQKLSEEALASDEEVEEADLEFQKAASVVRQLEEEKNLTFDEQNEEKKELKVRIRQWGEKLEEVEKNLEMVYEDLENVTVLSPIRGVILTHEVEKLKGNFLTEGQSFMEIGDTKKLVFKARVDERDISDVKMGNSAKIFLHAFPKRKYDPLEGKVEWITSKSTGEPGPPFYMVVPLNTAYYQDEDDKKEIRPGMMGEAEILVDEDATIFDIILDNLLK